MQYGKFTAPCYGFRVDRYRGIVYLKKKTRNGKWIYTKDVEEAKLFKSPEHLKKKNPEAGYYTDYNGVEIYMTSNYGGRYEILTIRLASWTHFLRQNLCIRIQGGKRGVSLHTPSQKMILSALHG